MMMWVRVSFPGDLKLDSAQLDRVLQVDHLLQEAGPQSRRVEAFRFGLEGSPDIVKAISYIQLQDGSTGLRVGRGAKKDDEICILPADAGPFILSRVGENWKIRGLAVLPDVNQVST